MKKIILALFIAISIGVAKSQYQYPIQSLVIESANLRTNFTNGGDLMSTVDTTYSSSFGLEYPKRTPLQISSGDTARLCFFSGGIWMSSTTGGSPSVSAVKYRSNGTWLMTPGPIKLSTGTIHGRSDSIFNKIWKISQTDIANFKSLYISSTLPIPTSSIPMDFLTWPAKGNKYYTSYTISEDLAPFVDLDKNGIYEPEQGDFPKIKGDTMFLTIMNDLGRTNSTSAAIGVEVLLSAFVINKPQTANTIYYDCKLTKKTSGDASDFIFGLFLDSDLGNFFDDYVGCDSTQNIGYVYNADNNDESRPFVRGYGVNPPVATCRFLTQKMGAFRYANNGMSSPTSDPNTDNETRTSMEGKWKTGQSMTVGGNGTGGTIPTKFVFPGDPCDASQWSMKSAAISPSDIRFLMSTRPINLKYNQPQEFNFKVSVFPTIGGVPCMTDSIIPKDNLIVKEYDSAAYCHLKITNVHITNDSNSLGKGKIELTITSSSGSYNTKWSSGEKNADIIANKSAGNYAVKILGDRHCVLDTSFVITNKMHMSLLEQSTQAIQVYPNPARGFLTIDLESKQKIQNISIYSMDGKLVRKDNIEAVVRSISYPLKDIPTGKYILKIKGENINYSTEIVHER